MEPKRYWWMSYTMYHSPEITPQPIQSDTVTELHPFIMMSKNNKDEWRMKLVNWKLISVEEYEIWQSLYSGATQQTK